MSDLPWEDNLLERKVESDLKDLLKTLVAFANSVKPGHVAVLLIGEKDDNTVQGVKEPDNIQKKIRKECDKIYPTILWRSKIYERDGMPCIRVEIEYSGETPHFGGPAWVRKGSETILATDELFQRLVDLRSSKINELGKWINKEVSIFGDEGSVPPPRNTANYGAQRIRRFTHRWGSGELAKIVFVNSHWVTFEVKDDASKVYRKSEPISKLTLSYDNNHDRLKVIIAY